MIASIILSSIAAVAAILAPVLTAIINNRHNLLIKRLEFSYTQKYEVYKRFSETYGKIQYRNYMEPQLFFSALYETMLLVNNEIRKELLKLNTQVLANDCYATKNTEPQFEICCQLLHEDLNKEKNRKKC